jgi:hypothetical protein
MKHRNYVINLKLCRTGSGMVAYVFNPVLKRQRQEETGSRLLWAFLRPCLKKKKNITVQYYFLSKLP